MKRQDVVLTIASVVAARMISPLLEHGAAVAAPVASEEIISVTGVNRHPDVLQMVTSRLTVPPETAWRFDPDLGPLTMKMETGALSVLLAGGSARIEREADPLTYERFGPLMPGKVTVLGAGDRLVVVRGFDLRVSNDGGDMATALVVHQQLSPMEGVTS